MFDAVLFVDGYVGFYLPVWYVGSVTLFLIGSLLFLLGLPVWYVGSVTLFLAGSLLFLLGALGHALLGHGPWN
jgi:hypothetical protein